MECADHAAQQQTFASCTLGAGPKLRSQAVPGLARTSFPAFQVKDSCASAVGLQGDVAVNLDCRFDWTV